MQKVWLQKGLDIIVVFGVGFLLGDGVLTPAISVVSAVEGLQIAPGVGNSISRSGPPPSLARFTVPPLSQPNSFLYAFLLLSPLTLSLVLSPARSRSFPFCPPPVPVFCL